MRNAGLGWIARLLLIALRALHRRRANDAHRQFASGFMQLVCADLLARTGFPVELALLGHLELVAGQLEVLDHQGQLVAQLSPLAGEVLALEDTPFLQYRHDDFVEVDARVVDTPDGDDHGFAPELGTWKPGIWKWLKIRCSDFMAWLGTRSNAASLTSR